MNKFDVQIYQDITGFFSNLEFLNSQLSKKLVCNYNSGCLYPTTHTRRFLIHVNSYYLSFF